MYLVLIWEYWNENYSVKLAWLISKTLGIFKYRVFISRNILFTLLYVAFFKEQLLCISIGPSSMYCNKFSGCRYVRSDLTYPSVPMLFAETGYWLWLPYYGHYKNIIETCHAGWRKCRFPGGFSIGHCYEYHQTLGRFLHVYISSDDFKISKYYVH